MQQLRKQKWGTTALAATIQKKSARSSFETAKKFYEKIQLPKNFNISHLENKSHYQAAEAELEIQL